MADTDKELSAETEENKESYGDRTGQGKSQLMAKNAQAIDPHNPVEAFKNLNFDPLTASVQLLKEIEKTIKFIKGTAKPSWPAVSTLYGVKERINTNLMKYAYRFQDPTTETADSRIPFSIELTDRGEVSIHVDGEEKKAKDLGLSDKSINATAKNKPVQTTH